FLRDTQAMVVVRGVIFLLILISFLTTILNLPAFTWLINTTLPALLFAIPVIFAAEIRRALERLGRAGNFLPTRQGWEETEEVISSVVQAASRLSTRRHGALIVLQRLDSLEEYVQTGVYLDAELTPELLLQIFYPNTPLHDGAVIVLGHKVIASACVMPLSATGVLAPGVDRKMGLRHRAAVGTSEVSDAVVIVVSEESGAISIATGGRIIHQLDSAKLASILQALYKPIAPTSGIESLLSRWFPAVSSDRETISQFEDS
ncbi:MAG: diadenylate cyclase CdaA, partial [Chloroflexota bacterium]